eukprot:13380698-Ditylum_brightwellii.AAC.1
MPLIPSNESIQLQFVLNNAVVEAAGRMTGHLNVVHRVQLRTLHNKHPDQHFVNAMTGYYKGWIVDVKKLTGKDKAKFIGQDDKAKIPVGDEIPVSSNVHIKDKAI